MSSASDVFSSANQENRSASTITPHFADPTNLKMVQQHMNSAASQDNRVERNTSLSHFPDSSNLKMVQLSNMGKLPLCVCVLSAEENWSFSPRVLSTYD